MKKDITKLPKQLQIITIIYRALYSGLYFFIAGYLGAKYYYEMQHHTNFVEIGMGVIALVVATYFLWSWCLEKISDFNIKRIMKRNEKI